MALHLYLTYSSEWHIHPGRNTSYHSDEWLSPRPEPFLPQWWNISTHSPGLEHILPQWWTTLTQVGTLPTTVMKYLCTHIWPGRNWILNPCQNGPQSLTELPSNGPGASTLLESGICPYIYPTRHNGQHSHLTWKELILSPWKNDSALTSDLLIRIAMDLALISDMEGTNPLTMSEWL